MQTFQYSTKDDVVQAAISFLEEEAKTYGEAVTTPQAARLMVTSQLRIGSRKREVFLVFFMNKQHQLIESEEMFTGTIDSAPVYPREVARRALELNAASCIVAHNHPGGSTEPSEADRRVTNRLKDALGLFDIWLLDHIVVTDKSAISFADRGML